MCNNLRLLYIFGYFSLKKLPEKGQLLYNSIPASVTDKHTDPTKLVYQVVTENAYFTLLLPTIRITQVTPHTQPHLRQLTIALPQSLFHSKNRLNGALLQ